MSLSRRNCTSCSHSSWVTSWWQVSLICMENGRSHILSSQFCMLRGNCPAQGLWLQWEMNVSNHSERDLGFLWLLPLCTTIKNRVGGIVRTAFLALYVARFQQEGLHRHFPVMKATQWSPAKPRRPVSCHATARLKWNLRACLLSWTQSQCLSGL